MKQETSLTIRELVSEQSRLNNMGDPSLTRTYLEAREIGVCLCGDNHCHVYTSTV